ncbi:ParA family protein [Candidatus Poribacteria bacterium]|nr:ParA family protein [Candidatus Poribacteria bacterium]
MALRIGVVSQKGGVGKSTLARLIACEYARAQWRVKIASLDLSQGTSYNWQSRRLQQGIHPEIAVEQFATIDQALRVADAYCRLPNTASSCCCRQAFRSMTSNLP